MAEANILIVEDDADIREGVRILLESENYHVEEGTCGQEGLQLLSEETDLVILDVMMPGMNGLRTCEEIRKKSNVPVLFLTAKAKESDKLIGLMAGGDDYLAKPFSYSELLGRVKALLRRYRIYKGKEDTGKGQPEKYLENDNIRICEDFNEVSVDGKEIELSDIEYNILLLLIRNPHRIFSAQNIYETIWNEPYFYTSSGTVMVHIRNLRVKVERDPQNPAHIKTVWGKGYRFE
jgi:two-component system OmpR family response regulator